jgi:signal recognition particle subunit SRP54
MFHQLTDKFESVFRHLRGLGKITDSNIQETAREIRRILLGADVHFQVAKQFIERVKQRAQGTKVIKSVKPGEQFIKIIHDELVTLLGSEVKPLDLGSKKPAVILLAGLQGSGKTTTCAKLANQLKKKGHSVLLVAADIYRPAAVEQLITLGKTIGVEVYSDPSRDPVVISTQALEHARQKKVDVVLLDTAGRLHLDDEMMAEIKAIANETQPVEILFVVDGMTGQDAVNSALAFSKALPLTGTILTKMEGDSRGGAAVSITEVTGVPVKFVGVSEKLDGLEPFDPERMVNRILGFGDVVSLVEKAQQVVDHETTQRLEKKLKSQSFDLEDFKIQLKQLKNMGPMDQILGMLPGMNRKLFRGMDVDDRQLSWTEAMINSMTPEERRNPHLINGSRRQRIARGSGRSVQEVNQLLRQFNQMQKLFKQMGKMKLPKHLNKSFMGLN